MKIALVQANLYWENCTENLSHFEKMIADVSDVNIFVLPEMFTTGFTMNTDSVSQKMDGSGVNWLKRMAKEKDAVFVASLIIEENKSSFNRLIWAFPDGRIDFYDKRHLFRMAGEHQHFSAGNKKQVITYKNIRFCPQICYDLRFPVWSRNSDGKTSTPIYDCLIYVANWPEVRSDAWISLLKARAIENQVFVVGVNRVGKDGKGINYSGDSRVFSPKGEQLDSIISGEEMIDIVEINLEELNDFRKKFPVSDDADFFEIQ